MFFTIENHLLQSGYFSLYSTTLLHFIIIIIVVLLLSFSYCSPIYWSSFYGDYFAFGFSSCQVLALILRLLDVVSMDLKDKPQLIWIKLTNTFYTAQIVTRLCGFNFNFPSVSDWYGQCIGVLYAKYLITSIMVVILQFSCKGLYGRRTLGEYISHSEAWVCNWIFSFVLGHLKLPYEKRKSVSASLFC